MTSELKVGVKYCGHCNPHINGPELVQNLKQRLQNIEIVGWDSPAYDVLLMVSACMSGCLNRPPLKGPWIEIVVNEIREYQITDGSKAGLLLKALRDEGLAGK